MDGSVYCRTCAAPSPGGDDVKNTKGLNDIFANEQINKLLSTLKEWQLDIMEDDGLPQCICETCELALKRIDGFRIQALSAKEYFRKRLRSIVNCVATTEDDDVLVEVLKISNNENDLHNGDTTPINYDEMELYHREAIVSHKTVTPPTPKVTYEFDKSTALVNKKNVLNNDNASDDNGSVEKVLLNDIELFTNAVVVNEQTDLTESSRPLEFQIVLIEEQTESQLQWIDEEEEHNIDVAGEKEEPVRKNEISKSEIGLITSTESHVDGNNHNNNSQQANKSVLMGGGVEKVEKGKQINTNKNIANENQQTTDYNNQGKDVRKNNSNKQAQEGVDVVIKENSQYRGCVREERAVQININAKSNTEQVLHSITLHENELIHDEEDSGINDLDLYLTEDYNTGINRQNFQGIILPLQQQANSEINKQNSYLAEECHDAQWKVKCADGNCQNFRGVILPLQQQQQQQSEINFEKNIAYDLRQTLDEDISEKYKNMKHKSPKMHAEITTTTESALQQITNKNVKLTHDDQMQIKEFQALLATFNEQVSTFETNKHETNSNYSNDGLDLDLQSIFMNDLTLQMINANVNIIEEDLQIDELETLLSLPVNEDDEYEEETPELAKEKTNDELINEGRKPNFLDCYEKIFTETENELMLQSYKAENVYLNKQGAQQNLNISRDLQHATKNVMLTETKLKNYEQEQFDEELVQCQVITSNEVYSTFEEKYADDDSGVSLILEDKLLHAPLNEVLYNDNTNEYLNIDNTTSFSNSVNSNFTTPTTTPEYDNNSNNKSVKPSTTSRRRRYSPASNNSPPNKKLTRISNILRCRFCVCKISEQPIFSTLQLLNEHIATIHDDKERPYNCPQCTARYRTRSGCVAHINAIHLKKFDNCKLCNKIVAGGTGQMRMHMERNHTHGNYTCEICHLELKNVTLYNFKYHKRWHDERKLWRCELCEKAFVTRTHLMAHKVTHTRQGEFLCTRCGKSTRSKWELRTHLYAIHGEGEAPLQCNYCDEKFTQHIQKRAHVERYHPNEQQTKRTTVPCTKCDKQFSTETNLQRHIKKHHNEGSFDVLMKKVAAASSPPQYEGFMCAHCPRKYRSKYALIKHLRVHTKMPDKPYSCPDCFMHFKHFSELDRHDLQHHATVRPYNCDECSKRFSTRTALKVHRQIHEVKGRNFRCPECDQRFKFEKSLNLHRISHKTMRHSCDICNKSYIRLTQLKTHKNRYHQMQSDSEEE